MFKLAGKPYLVVVLGALLAVALLLVGAACGGDDSESVEGVVSKAIAEAQAAAPEPLTAPEVKKVVEAALQTPKEAIVFGDLDWDSAQIQAAIARFIVEHGYGYPTEAIFGGSTPLWAGLLKGDVDVLMEWWLPNGQEVWDKALSKGEVIPVGKSLDDNWQSAFVVPTYVAEQNPDLKTVQDIRDHTDLFPTEGGQIVLWNCLAAWKCSGVNEAQVKAYGLDDIIVLKDPGSQASLFASLQGAYSKGEPWLGYLWGPTQPSAELDLTILEEPTCASGQAPTDGCGYPTANIRLVVHPTLVQRAPEVIEFLRKWDFTAETDVAANAYKAESGANFEELAIWYLENQEQFWGQWVPADVALKVKAALP